MDIRQLRYFLTVAEEGQFTKASQKLNMAQPPLSQQIHQLEEELGVKLFIRGRYLELTQAGQILLSRTQQILHLTSVTANELEDYRTGSQGTIAIGTVSSCSSYYLPRQMLRFHQLYPGVRFILREGNAYRVKDLVEKGIVDVGIVRTPFDLEAFNYLYQPAQGAPEPMSAVFSDHWQKYLGPGPLKLAALEKLPLIIQRRYQSLIVEACESAGFKPDILCQSDDLRTSISCAEFGLGIAITPQPPPNLLQLEGLLCRQLAAEELQTRTAVIWPKDSYQPQVVVNFLKSLQR
jgi:DNA-binding transcriptional LysR family regulator